MPVVFSYDFTGTDNDPWDPSKFVEDNNGTGDIFLDTNRGAMSIENLPNDARAIFRLNLIDARADMLLTIPTDTGTSGGVYYGFGINLRTDGQWGAGGGGGAPHDPLNGYRYICYRSATSEEFSLAIFRMVAGVATELPGALAFGSSAVTQVRLRVEAVGSALRAVARDASLGALPDTWDIDTTDATFSEGLMSVSVRGPTGGSIAARIGYLDELQVSVPDAGGGGPHIGGNRIIRAAA